MQPDPSVLSFRIVDTAGSPDGRFFAIDPDRILDVRSGSIDICLERPGRAGRRRLCTLSAGEIAVAPDFGGSSWRLIAIPTSVDADAMQTAIEPFLELLDAGDATAILKADAWHARMMTDAAVLAPAEVTRANGSGLAAGRNFSSRAFLEEQKVIGLRLAADQMALVEAMRSRIAGNGAYDRAVLDASMASLGLKHSSEAAASPVRLADVFRDVAEASGAKLPDGFGASALPDRVPLEKRLADLAAKADIGLRRVRLDANWWRQGGHSLLAFRHEDGSPIALIAGSGWRSGYRMRDGAKLRNIGEEDSAAIAPFAYILQRRLPRTSVDGRGLLRFVGPVAAPLLVPMLVLAALSSGLGLVVPVASGILFETVIPSASHVELLQLTAGIAALGLGGIVFELVRGFLLLRLVTLLNTDLEGAIWDRLLHLPAAFFRKYSSGDLALRAAAINQMRDAMSGTVITTVVSAIVSVSSLTLILTYDWRLAALAVVLVLIELTIMVGFSLRILSLKREALGMEGRLQSLALQLVQAISKLKVAGAETRGFARWAPTYIALRDVELRQQTYSAGFAAFGTFFGIAGTGLVIAMVGLRGIKLGIGDFVTFMAAFGQFVGATIALGSVLPQLLSLKPLYARAEPFLEAVPEARRAQTGELALRGGIEVRDLTFRYRADGPAVLEGVSLHARPGEFVAVVGASGCGKSTLLRLLLGFETPEQGTISIDGHDLNGIDARAVRRQMGVVLQNSRILNGTIIDNVRGGAALVEADIWAAIGLAGFDEDVRAMPMGLHTFVGEDGILLSGGQRQRLLIARALVRRPRMVLFDEATSALDNQTQQLISDRLAVLDATRIVIAHRLSTIEKADRIYVLESGRIVEEGDYRSLVARGGKFADLARHQTW